jgi:phosphoenolpyruvate carboxykinase (GTP)
MSHISKRYFTELSTFRHEGLKKWVQATEKLCKPDKVLVCDGSVKEIKEVTDLLVNSKVFIPLSSKKRPGSFLVRTDPADVARSEKDTFICPVKKDDAGPTNNWADPSVMNKRLEGLFKGCMTGRTMYVIPFSMGPIGSRFSVVGVQITDSPYVVYSMNIMTRICRLGSSDSFVKCLHSVGSPLKQGQKDGAWPCNIKNRAVAHFPESKSVISFGSGYGGNSLLGKKALALRIASVMGREQGWLAEHMLILGVTPPNGKKHYVAAAFPSACGKTNMAMMQPSLPGWKVECVGDDICWLRFGSDGRLYAVNPENGIFGVAPGTSSKSNPYAIETIQKNAVFTNVAFDPVENDVWWEGLTKQPPAKLIDWLGQPYDKRKPAAHPNSRFTAPITQCPIIDPNFNSLEGVPISAILFGGRRQNLVPLVFECLSWNHGVLVGSSIGSETTAAAEGSVGSLRYDPFAMLPFCGYNMGDYFQHWINMGKKSNAKLPKIFHVNWFRKDSKGNFIWPGFGENCRGNYYSFFTV